MVAFGLTALFLALSAPFLQTAAVPIAQSQAPAAGASGYWLADIQHEGVVPFGNDKAFKVFRNVKDYGAVGDGTTDDTAAIQKAISEGDRCAGVPAGPKCDSSTTTPVIVYFPAGTYIVSKPIIQYYYTQFIGDANNLPTIKATPGFLGLAMIDANPYVDGGNGENWFTNQNNFYRQIRNFKLDLTEVDAAVSCIHWQVSQATSLQNIVFNLPTGEKGKGKKGIFMENGSGGFMTDLTFNGGEIGAFLGSQQFTSRNMTFNNCEIGIQFVWNWLWVMHDVTFNDCGLGVDMANNPSNQTVGSVLVLDSKFVNTPIGVNTSFAEDSIPHTGGTLILDNVDFAGSQTAVQTFAGQAILPGGQVIQGFAQGNALASGAELSRVQGPINGQPQKPAALLEDGSDKIFARSKPQYEGVPVANFVSLKSKGAKGDGIADDTDAIQSAIDGLTDGQVLFVPHGAYLISKTVTVPAAKNVKIVGEIWPMFMATGEFFSNMDDPKPAFKIGETSGDQGTFEMSDCIVTTKGPAPGAILMEWNINSPTKGGAGLWDTHFRIAGFAGTDLQSDKCTKNPETKHDPNPECIAAFMAIHITKQASALLENVWVWVADHELDIDDHNQIDIYNGRGMLIESQGPVWLWGTASEHSQLSQYHLQGAKNVFMGHIQTETPYMQPNPPATVPFTKNDKYFDPDFSTCTTDACRSAWAVRIIDSEDIWLYGTGTYSFFSNYDQQCVPGQNCQENINQVDGSSAINWFGMSTKASVNMLTTGGQGVLKDEDNRSNFCATVAIFAIA